MMANTEPTFHLGAGPGDRLVFAGRESRRRSRLAVMLRAGDGRRMVELRFTGVKGVTALPAARAAPGPRRVVGLAMEGPGRRLRMDLDDGSALAWSFADARAVYCGEDLLAGEG